MQRWTVVVRGRPVGEFAEGQLAQWIAEGRAGPADLVWCPGMAAAAPMSVVPAFAGLFRPAPSSPPRWLVPVGCAPWAVAAGLLGVGSFFPLLGPFAVLAGILGLNQIKQDRRRRGRGRAIFGIVAGGLASVALVLIALTGQVR